MSVAATYSAGTVGLAHMIQALYRDRHYGALDSPYVSVERGGYLVTNTGQAMIQETEKKKKKRQEWYRCETKQQLRDY